jgi:hypothetical protein
MARACICARHNRTQGATNIIPVEQVFNLFTLLPRRRGIR